MKTFFLSLLVTLPIVTAAETPAPPYCEGVAQDDEVERVKLLLNSNRYGAGGAYYEFYAVQGFGDFAKRPTRQLGFVQTPAYEEHSPPSLAGPILGMLFTGSGHASWHLEIVSQETTKFTGKLTLSFYNSHDALNGGGGDRHEVYEVTCHHGR